MAIAGDKETFRDDLSAGSVWDLQQQFPEIPADVVSAFLKKHSGNMSRCVEELEQASPSYLYGEFVSSETPTDTDRTMQNTMPQTNDSALAYAPRLYSPQRGVHSQDMDSHHRGYHPMEVGDHNVTPQPQSFTSWASLETGVPDMETLPEPRQNPMSAVDERRHMSSCTVHVDMQKPPMRTVSVPQINTIRSASPMPMGPHVVEVDPIHRQASSPYGRTTSNGFEQVLDPRDFPFEPRPAWQEKASPSHISQSNEANANKMWTPSPTHMKPAEVQSTTHIATSYQLDPLKPSSPASTPQRGKKNMSPAVASYSKATERISLNPTTPTNQPRPSAAEQDDTVHQTASDQGVVDLTRSDHPSKSGLRSKPMEDNGLKPPSDHPPQRSISKEKEDQAYTEALLMHQRARYERLSKELEEEKKTLAHMREETSNMEKELAHKRHHRSPFPTPEQITRLREQKRQLQIDIECMTREIESHKSQGLMDQTQANSFYGNMGSTGAPGPVPPIPSQGNLIPETVLDNPAALPSYESVMEGQMWSCSACTLLNHPALDKCECCEMPRDK